MNTILNETGAEYGMSHTVKRRLFRAYKLRSYFPKQHFTGSMFSTFTFQVKEPRKIKRYTTCTHIDRKKVFIPRSASKTRVRLSGSQNSPPPQGGS